MMDFDTTDEDLMWDDPPGWSTVQTNRIMDVDRWSYLKRRVISNGTTYAAILWRVAATEYQDQEPDLTVIEMVPILVTDYTRKT